MNTINPNVIVDYYIAVDGTVAHSRDHPAQGRAEVPRGAEYRHLSHGASLQDRQQRPQDAVARARRLRRVQVPHHGRRQPWLLAFLGASEWLVPRQ